MNITRRTGPILPEQAPAPARIAMELHPAEVKLIEFMRRLRFGRLERLDIQNGLPVSAEECKGRVRFDQGKEGEKRG